MGETFGTWLPCIVIGAILLGALLRYERRRIAEETRRTVIASVMDAQNNFLNNMMYFRNRAEIEGTLSAADLIAMECAIRETQGKLVMIAEADLRQTRNLGGIRIVRAHKQKLAG